MSDTTNTDAAKLASKISRLIGKAEYVQKTGKNIFHNYKYATEGDFLALMKPLLSQENMAVIPSLISEERIEAIDTVKGKKQWITKVQVKFSIIDGDTGYREVVIFPGAGIDSEEKGLYKALTGCVKYFLSKLFLIETGDDPEREPEESPKSESAGKPPQSKQAPPANNTPAEGKAEPRPGEKKNPEPAPKEKTLEEATKETLDQAAANKAEKKSQATTSSDPLPTKEQFDGYIVRLEALRNKLGGAGTEESKKLKAFIYKSAKVKKSGEITAKSWEAILKTLESAKEEALLRKLVGA